MESGYTYPERADNKLAAGEAHPQATTDDKEVNLNFVMVLSAVSRGHSRLDKKPPKEKKRWKHSHKIEGLNVRIGERTKPVYRVGVNQPNRIRELLI